MTKHKETLTLFQRCTLVLVVLLSFYIHTPTGPSLEKIDLSTNNLGGTLGPEIGSFANLSECDTTKKKKKPRGELVPPCLLPFCLVLFLESTILSVGCLAVCTYRSLTHSLTDSQQRNLHRSSQFGRQPTNGWTTQ